MYVPPSPYPRRAVVTACSQRGDHREPQVAGACGHRLRLQHQPAPEPGMLGRVRLSHSERQRFPIHVQLAHQRRTIEFSHPERRTVGRRQRKPQVGSQTVFGRHERKEVLFGSARRVDQILELNITQLQRPGAHLAASDTHAPLPAPCKLRLRVHPQACAPVAGNHIARRDVPHHSVHAAVARDGRLQVGQQADQFFGRVRRVLPASPVGLKPGARQQLAGVDLDLIRSQVDIAPQLREVETVRLQRCAKQVRHPVQDDLEAGRPQQPHRLPRVGDRMPAVIQLQDAIIETLRTELHFGDPQRARARARLPA